MGPCHCQGGAGLEFSDGFGVQCWERVSGGCVMHRLSFSNFAWGLLAYNLAVIVWGAFVRASFSGDGCGAHWPNCGGTVIPDLHRQSTLIEFIHRASTGIAILLVGILVTWAVLGYPRHH